MAESNPVSESHRELFVSVPEDRINVRIGTGTYSIVIAGDNTQGRLAFIDMWVPPGDGPMPHTHECEETFYVVEGEVTVFCRETRALAKTGMAVAIPGWAPHVFYNLSQSPARIFCIVSPAGLDRQFQEIGPCVADKHSPSPPVTEAQKSELMKKIPAIVEKYNGKLLPPDTFDHLMTIEELKLVHDAQPK